MYYRRLPDIRTTFPQDQQSTSQVSTIGVNPSRTVGQTTSIAWRDLLGDLDRRTRHARTRDHFREYPASTWNPATSTNGSARSTATSLEREHDEKARHARNARRRSRQNSPDSLKSSHPRR